MVFDWRELRRWNIPVDRLPAQSIVQFREPTFWERNRWRVIATISISAVQTLLIAALMVNRRKRRRAEQALVESSNRLIATLNTAVEAVIAVSPPNRVEFVNSAAEKMFGYTAAEMIDHDIGRFIPAAYQRESLTHAASLTPPTAPRETAGRRKDGSTFAIELAINEVITADRRYLTYFVLDLTERKRSEEMTREFSRRLLRAQEAERARLARELHDDITQRLARLAIDTSRLIYEKDKAARDKTTTELREELGRLSEDVHSLAYRLHPSLLERLGLVEALRSECQRFSRQEPIKVSTRLDEIGEPIPADVALCIFRVAQEALRNVARHAHAKTVDVSLRPSNGGLWLAIRDTGAGFRYGSEIQRNGLGLSSMRERVRLIGGHLKVVSEPGGGTTVSAWAPLQEQVDRAIAFDRRRFNRPYAFSSYPGIPAVPEDINYEAGSDTPS
jgi:PAS domain S-box-containing protein